MRLLTSRGVNEARRLIRAASRVLSKEKNVNKKTKSRRTQKTPQNPQQPGDRDQLETTCDETRPTR